MDGDNGAFVPGSGSKEERNWIGMKTGALEIVKAGAELKQFDYGKIDNMKLKINTYISLIDAVLDRINSTVVSDYTNAVFGAEQVEKIQGYVANSVKEIKKLTEFIGQFGTALDTVKLNYEAQNKSVTTRDVVSATTAIGGDDLTGVSGFGG